MNPRSQSERFQDIIDRIERIKFAEVRMLDAEKKEDLAVSTMAFDSILYNLVVIGEAVKRLSDSTRDRFLDIPWSDVTGMRDILAHEYFRINSQIVRSTIDLPLSRLYQVCLDESAKQ